MALISSRPQEANDLAQDVLKICGDVVPVSVNPSPGFLFLKVTVAKRTVLPLNTVSYVKEELQTPITGPYEIEPGPHKIIYCQMYIPLVRP